MRPVGERRLFAIGASLVALHLVDVLRRAAARTVARARRAHCTDAAVVEQAEHGLGGEERNRVYFERARQPKSYWLIKGSSHTGGFEARPAEYERRVVSFVDRALVRGG